MFIIDSIRPAVKIRYVPCLPNSLCVKMNPMTDLLLDKFREECAVFGVFGHNEASTLTQLGLFALQHGRKRMCPFRILAINQV